MSLLSELQAALNGRKLRGMDAAFYPDWASFWKACPLSRRMFARHRADGSEYITPENDPQHYHDQFFTGDSVGIVLTLDGQPVTGLVYRRTAPDTVENTLRVGAPAGQLGIRAYFWDLGCRRMTYKIAPDKLQTRAHMDQLEKQFKCKRTEGLEADGYLHYCTELTERPLPPEDLDDVRN